MPTSYPIRRWGSRPGFRDNACAVISLLTSRFARDSPLEGDGFEPSVSVAREPVYIAEGELRGDRRAAKKIWRGTDGSNPSPSSEESAANLWLCRSVSETGSVTSHRRLDPVFFGIEPCRGHGAVGVSLRR